MWSAVAVDPPDPRAELEGDAARAQASAKARVNLRASPDSSCGVWIAPAKRSLTEASAGSNAASCSASRLLASNAFVGQQLEVLATGAEVIGIAVEVERAGLGERSR